MPDMLKTPITTSFDPIAGIGTFREQPTRDVIDRRVVIVRQINSVDLAKPRSRNGLTHRSPPGT
jgi:hypothetical protein